MTATSNYRSLTDAELELLDCKLAIIRAIKAEQRRRRLTMPKFAAILGLSQIATSALLECEADATLDELACAYFDLGKNREDFGKDVCDEVAMAWGIEMPRPQAKRTKAVSRIAIAPLAGDRQPERLVA